MTRVHSADGPPPAVRPAARTDAGEGIRRPAHRRRLAVRAEVGWLPGDRLSRRRRGLHPVARPEAARSLLPGTGRPAPRGAPGAMRAGWRGRHRPRRSAGVRGAAAADPSGRVAGEDAGRVESPASFVAWDLLAIGDEDLRDVPAGERRARLESGAGRRQPPVHLSPATLDRATAADWFDRFEGAGLDGVVAKRLDGVVPAREARDAQGQAPADRRLRGRRLPLAQERPRDAHRIAAARAVRRRRHAPPRRRHVHVHLGPREPSWPRNSSRCARTPSTVTRGREWAEWASAGDTDASGQRLPGATSRWNRGKDLSWEPLRVERVAEVAYDHLQGARFRHGTTFKRWRPDKPTTECRYDQLEETAPYLLASIFGS